MSTERLRRIEESFQLIAQEMQEAVAANQEHAVEHNRLRALRLLSKLEGMDSTGSLKGINAMIRQVEAFLAECSAHLASQYELEGHGEYAVRERLLALTLNRGNSGYYLQYAHTLLQAAGFPVGNDMDTVMQRISPEQSSGVFGVLTRAKYSAQAACEDLELEGAASETVSWIDSLQHAIKNAGFAVTPRLTGGEEEITLEQALRELEQMIGLAGVKQQVRDICNWVEFNRLRRAGGYKQDVISLHMVFSGNPGTGKTTVARAVGKIFKALGVLKKGHVVEVDRSELVAEYVGQTAVKTMKKIKEAHDGILFIDEAYSLTRSTHQDFGVEAVDTIVKEMEDKRSRLVVILAGYPAEMEGFLKANPGLHSRFTNQIVFPDYTLEELLSIADSMVAERQFRMTDGARKELEGLLRREMANLPTTHGNARLVRNFIEHMILKKASMVVERGGSKPDLDLLDTDILREAAGRLLNGAGGGLLRVRRLTDG